jgi:hypothetical protein
MYNINLLYDNWFLGKPLPNCLRPEILNHIKLNEKMIDTEMHILSFNIEKEFGNKHNVWMANIGIKKELNKVQFSSNDWVYPIEPWGHIMYSLNLDAIDDYYNFFSLIPKEIIESVNNGIGKIVINYAHEGWVSEFLLKGMYVGCKNSGIKLDKVILLLNDYNLESKIEKFKTKFNLSSYPTTINYSYYLTASANHLYKKYNTNQLIKKHCNIPKTYKFLCLNRRLDLHRVKLISELYDYIKNESLISFDKFLITDEVPSFLNKDFNLNEKFEKLPNKVVADRIDIQNTNGYEHESHHLFKDAYVNIVTETSFYIENDFISEKIWKPLYHFQPIIVVGRPYLLKYLKEIGFKTFDWLIDETYDTIEDNNLRMEMIINEVKKLNDLSIFELHEIINKHFYILEHNHNLLNKIGNNIDNIQNFVIEKVKEDNYTYTDIFKEINLDL